MEEEKETRTGNVNKYLVISDPVHGYIKLREEHEINLVNSPYFQRLRYIKQNGPAYLVYPTSRGARFEHSLGSMVMATRMLQNSLDHLSESKEDSNKFLGWAIMSFENWNIDCSTIKCFETLKEYLIKIVRSTALVHDIGHLPFSHTTEEPFAKLLQFKANRTQKEETNLKPHEIIGIELVRQQGFFPIDIQKAVLLTLLSADKIYAQELGLRGTVFELLKATISSEIDSDRGDYLLRDGIESGSGFGIYDKERLITSMRIVESRDPKTQELLYVMAPDIRALSTVESFLLGRYEIYKWICWHHKVLFYDEIVKRLTDHALSKGTILNKNLKETALKKGHTSEPVNKEVIKSWFKTTENHLFTSSPYLYLVRDGDKNKVGLNPNFLIKTEPDTDDEYYLDDYWLINSFRKIKSDEEDVQLLKDALLKRKSIGVSFWKDNEQFMIVREDITNTLIEKNYRGLKLRDMTEARNAVLKCLQDDFMSPEREMDRKKLYNDLEKKLKNKLGPISEIVIIRDGGPRLIEDAEKIKIITRGSQQRGYDSVKLAADLSLVLERLSNLKHEIPFYVYILCKLPPSEEEKRTVKASGIKEFVEEFCKGLIEADKRRYGTT